MKGKLKNTKGITLVALIITIIVLLILAMVSIRLVMNGGIIGRAEDGTEKYSVAEEKEQIQLGYKEYQMAKYQEANPTLKVEGATNVTPKDGGGWTVTFPSGRVYEVAADGTITGGETANLPEDAVASLAKAGEIQRWDTINYDPGSLTTASINLPEGASIEGTKLGSINLPDGALLNGTINANSASDWVVIDVNQATGEVLIMPRTVSEVDLRLSGKDGYNNAIQAINEVASIYKNPTYAASARGITVEDINKLTGHTPDGQECSFTRNNKYGMDSNLNITGSDESAEKNQTYTSTAETGIYQHDATKVFGYTEDREFWIASRCVQVGDDHTYFGLRYFVSGHINYLHLFMLDQSKKRESYSDNPVVPVVTLKPNVQLESSSKFYTKTATATQGSETQTGDYTFEHNTWSFK